MALARARFQKFLLIARRWNLEIHESWDFTSPEWDSQLRRYAQAHGSLEPPYGGIDLFVYSRGLWGKLPPFAVGRTRWDSALVYQARRLGAPVIDATSSVTSVHQTHGYSHYPQNTAGVFKGPEALHNEKLLGGEQFIFTALNATHVMKKSGIHRNLIVFPPYLLRRAATLPAFYPSLRRLSPLVHYIAPWWRAVRKSWVF